MKLTKWTPMRDLTSDFFNVRRDLDRFFDSFLRGDYGTEDPLFPAVWTPAADIIERDDAYLVKLELPGVKKNEVKITIENNILTVSGEKKQENELKDKEHYRFERMHGAFRRSFTLPSTVKGEKIEAVYEDGILTISLPKAEEAKPKAIEIKVK